LLRSGSSAERADGLRLAERIWRDTETDAEVSTGMRRTCAVPVIDMLNEAEIPFNP
jgi:hypothetical protein